MDAAANFRTYLRICWRKRWLLALPLLLCTAASVVALQYLPRVYRATTLILVQPPNIPSEYVKPTVRTEESIKTIQQQITSRTRLEQVAGDLGLFSLQDDPKVVEARVAQMRSGIILQVKEERSFMLSFTSADPEEAARVANRLAELFIEANASRRQALARDTSEFLADELERMRVGLAGQETAIADFKRRHQPELPVQQDANLRALDSLARELRDSQMSITRARDRKALLETQLSALPPESLTDPAAGTDSADPRMELVRLRRDLESLRQRYTDRYPEVVRLQEQVAALERTVRALPPIDPAEPTRSPNPAYDRLWIEVQAADMEIAHLEEEAARIREEESVYRARVENSPQREQELLSLTRDYETLKQNYQTLLNKKTEAGIAETLEAERQGEQFIVLDRAKAPATPYRPNPMQVIALGVLAGLVLGVGCVALLEVMRPTFYSPQQIQEALGVPVIAAIPVIEPTRGRGKAAADAAALVLAVGAAILRLMGGLA